MASIDLMRNDPAAKDVTTGETIFSIGEPGEHAFVVIEGEVELELHGRILETVGAGGIFGEMALIDTHERSATASVKTAGRIVPIDRKRFLYLVQNTPYFAVEVMQVMAERLRRMDATV